MAYQKRPTAEEILASIQSLDLSLVKMIVMEKEQLSLQKWRVAENTYKKFLRTIFFYPPYGDGRIVIYAPPLADKLWKVHASLPFYNKDCLTFFNCIVPRIPVEGSTARYREERN